MLRAVFLPFGISFCVIDVGKILGSGIVRGASLNDIEEYRKRSADEGYGDKDIF